MNISQPRIGVDKNRSQRDVWKVAKRATQIKQVVKGASRVATGLSQGWVLGLLLLMLLSLAGCNLGHVTNPSFDVSVQEAWDALEQMADDPKQAQRPVVILGGWQGKSLNQFRTYQLLTQALQGSEIITVTYGGIHTMTAARVHTLETILAAESISVSDLDSSQPPIWTQPVDVIGISMGGIVARDAQCPPRGDSDGNGGSVSRNVEHGSDGRGGGGGGRGGGDIHARLKIHTLYGISVPHEGLRLGMFGFSDPLAGQMIKNSETNARIKAYFKPGQYVIEDYGRLGDIWVGVDKAQLPGQTIRWLPNVPFEDPHLGFQDPRIVADILRRIRGEQPLSREPAAPLPDYR